MPRQAEPRSRSALLLLGGWLLMYPSVARNSDGSGRLRTDLPVAQWEQHSAYDKAADCQIHLEEFANKGSANVGKGGWDKTKLLPTQAYDVAIQSARCVPAEHIYPPKK